MAMKDVSADKEEDRPRNRKKPRTRGQEIVNNSDEEAGEDEGQEVEGSGEDDIEEVDEEPKAQSKRTCTTCCAVWSLAGAAYLINDSQTEARVQRQSSAEARYRGRPGRRDAGRRGR